MSATFASYETLDVRDAPHGVRHLTLNRPGVRNAMSLLMVGELRAALDEAVASGAVRIVVLRGAGGHFCAGADLKDMAAARQKALGVAGGNPGTNASTNGSTSGSASPGTNGQSPAAHADTIAEVNARFGHLCLAFARAPLAVVAVLEGSVMGGGFGLACVADVTIASTTASFRLPETSLGVVPAQIAPFLVERLGPGEAKRLAVTGGVVDSQQALSIRLVHSVHAPEQLDAALQSLLHQMLQCAPGAVAATKALMHQSRGLPGEAFVAEAAAVFSRSAQSAEGLEGTAAFIARRRPSWAPE